ncbi:hypothetical protein [Scleromatobacter humisilvae]|uniref:Lipoprotein n=1 Tax=Scleromatobacter humisilvae TaxID=2897159 RepID=A0A9X2C132_9BURK|nr:hypothetical protein [Scleromatobacter humisilvae]MCK9688428.1 hypothetical protein [Scleromatobacter humisilvae]
MATLRSSPFALSLLCALAGCEDAGDPWHDLVSNHVTTTGHVSRVDCADRDAVSVAFQAGSRTYVARSVDGAIDCSTARVGDPMLVFYAPQDPDISTLLPPAEAYGRGHRWTSAGDAWLALAGAAAIALSIVAKVRATGRRVA